MSAVAVRRAAAFTAVLGVLGLLAACTAAPQTTPTELPAASAAPSSPAPEAPTTPTPEAATEPTCETIIPSSMVDEFTNLGWTAKSEPMRVGSLALTDGIMCTWGNYTVASDRLQIYGWAAIDDTQRTAAIAELLAAGWTRESSATGTYVTESADTAIATDDDGYGLTYLFGDGWVTYSDTRQGLVLVEWPPA